MASDNRRIGITPWTGNGTLDDERSIAGSGRRAQRIGGCESRTEHRGGNIPVGVGERRIEASTHMLGLARERNHINARRTRALSMRVGGASPGKRPIGRQLAQTFDNTPEKLRIASTQTRVGPRRVSARNAGSERTKTDLFIAVKCRGDKNNGVGKLVDSKRSPASSARCETERTVA